MMGEMDFDVSLSNLTVATILAFGIDKVVEYIWRGDHHPLPSSKGGVGDGANGLLTAFLFGATRSISVSARTYLGLLAIDLFLKRFPIVDQPQNSAGDRISLRLAAPVIAMTIWIGLTLCTIKRIVLMQLVSGHRLGRVILLDRFLNFIVALVVALCILDELSIDLTRGFQTVLSAGGIGALVFSLAAKDLAEQIVGGFALGAWDALNVGDKVQLSNGVSGKVHEIGLLETIIVGYDNIETRIPNSQMTTARVCNLSNVKRRREQQTLRFRYSDLDKVQDALDRIVQEIQLSCPKLSKTSEVVAVLKEFQTDHIEAQVTAHFDIPPATLEGQKNRHEFLMAIARAMKQKHVTFALPILLSEDQRIDKQSASA